MLRALRDWLVGRRKASEAGWPHVEAWCAQRLLGYTPDAAGGGFAVHGRLGATGWRLEWGRPQRLYIRGRGELLLQADLGLAPELHLMLLEGALHQRLERAVLDQIAGATDGRVDPHMPPEMRWVVTFARLDTQQAGWPAGFEAVASHPEWMLAWASGPLAQALGSTPAGGPAPWVLTAGGGRLELRAGLDEPEPVHLEAWITLFECAMREARRVQIELGETGEPTTLPSMWAVPRD